MELKLAKHPEMMIDYTHKRENGLRREVAKTGHVLHRRRASPSSVAGMRPWYIVRGYDNFVVMSDAVLEDVEAWVAEIISIGGDIHEIPSI
jgi:hypothetical protein